MQGNRSNNQLAGLAVKTKSKPKGARSWGCVTIVSLVCGLIMTGTFISLWLMPSDEGSSSGVSTNSLFATTVFQRSKKLSERIREWLGRPHDDDAEVSAPEVVREPSPPWEQEFWTPIDIMSVDSDPMVILCKLNFKQYSESPHLAPMFKDLVGISGCQGSNRKREPLKKLLKEISDKPNEPSSRVVKPNGFVFHESRVGSTLVANFMASDPYAMVFSESSPMASAILHCESCTHEYNVQLFRDVTALMGRSPFHKYLFFKFQSITVTQMNIALEVCVPSVIYAQFRAFSLLCAHLICHAGVPRRALGFCVPPAGADDDVAPGPGQEQPGQRSLHAQQAAPATRCEPCECSEHIFQGSDHETPVLLRR
jgi:hypothetical protein